MIRQALGMAVLGGFVATATADCTVTMQGTLAVDAPVDFSFAPKAALAPWQMMAVTGGFDANADGSRNFACVADARCIDGRVRIAEPKPGVVTCEWTFEPKSDLKLIVLGLMSDLKIADYGGGQLTVDGETMPVQHLGEIRDIRRKGLKRLSLTDAQGGKRLDWAFREPVDLHVQYWGGETLSFRILLPADDGYQSYAAGRRRALTFSLKGAGRLRESRLNPVTVRAGADWIPFTAAGEIVGGSALDLSAMRPTGKPAGRHGRVVRRGAHFEFESLPGVPQRFYGANLCGTANYPETLEDARRIAQNLARIGYNTVRIHHHDSHCVDRTKPGRTELDEAMMRRMDNLFKACAEEGLYITTDLFVSRMAAGIAWRDLGVDRDGSLSMEDYKYTVPVHEGAYSNFLAFARNFLSHVNVHTGVRYAEDPTLAWISLVNEGNIEKPGADGYASRPGWQAAWSAWLAQKRREEPSAYAGLSDAIPNRKTGSREGAAFTLFLRDVETRFTRRTAAALRAWGCKALVSDMNDCTGVMVGMTPVRGEVFDYLDTHFYVDHPGFFERPWALPSYCPNTNPLKGEALGAAKVTTLRVLDRPFTVSEYNFSGPGRYRGVGGILTGVEAALQDWSGLWRFQWAHHASTALRPGTEGLGYFDIASDPLQLASERASICLFLRGDLKPLRRTFAVTVPPEKAQDLSMPVAASALFGWQWAGWYAKTGFLSAPSAPPGTDWAVGFDAAANMTAGDVRRLLFGSDALPAAAGDGAVRVDGMRGSFSVETPLTAGGFVESGTLDAGAVRASLGGALATVWASSLDGRPIRESGRLLVTHLTDVQNTGVRYADEDMRIVTDLGSLPYLMRRGTAEVSVARAADAPPCRVYALDATGARRGEVPSRFEGGRLAFTADVGRDPNQATYLYEVVAEPSVRRLSVESYRDKMKAGWLGQMIGVEWGLPTEFCYQGRTIPDAEVPAWKPEMINGSFANDDLFVEMTFLRTLERHGFEVSPKQAGIDYANATFGLCAANWAGRDNLRRGIAPPDCGHPRYNACADNIDYQIESDYAGLISPGMPQRTIELSRLFGTLVNSGDGIWAGAFMGGMYAEAFFTRDIDAIIDAGLACIPPESHYAEMVRDVRAWHRALPDDWRACWRKVKAKYIDDPAYHRGRIDQPGSDVKPNGAFLLMGLLYGNGDLARTVKVAMQCGWDSDCNPSSAAGVLLTARGTGDLAPEYVSALDGGRKFSYSDYRFGDLLRVCERLMRQNVVKGGGRIERDSAGKEWIVVPQTKPIPDAYRPNWNPPPLTGARYTAEEMRQIVEKPFPGIGPTIASGQKLPLPPIGTGEKWMIGDYPDEYGLSLLPFPNAPISLDNEPLPVRICGLTNTVIHLGWGKYQLARPQTVFFFEDCDNVVLRDATIVVHDAEPSDLPPLYRERNCRRVRSHGIQTRFVGQEKGAEQ